MVDVRDRLLDAVLGLCRSQWTAIGVNGGVEGAHAKVVDPEALTLATLTFGRHDPRLFDEMLDWLRANAHLVDLARLRRIARNATGVEHRLVGVVASLLAEAPGGVRWQAVGRDLEAREALAAYAPEQLFLAGGTCAPEGGPWDEAFAAAGFLRPPVELDGGSGSPDARDGAALRFRARALCGTGAKAESLTYLWTHTWAHGRLVAERGAYDQAAVARYLSELADGHLAESRTEGRRLLYRLEPRLAKVGRNSARYVDWLSVFRALVVVWRAVGELPDPVTGGDWAHVAEALGDVSDDLAAEGFGFTAPDLRDGVTRDPETVADVVDALAARVAEFA